MWIITILPEPAIHAIVLLGIVGIVAGFLLGVIPFIGKYKLPIQVISLLVFAIGLYLEGALSEKKEWDARVKDLEIKLAEAEVKASKVNTEIVTKVITKKQIIKEKGDTVVKYLTENSEKINNSCPIAKPVIISHNAAAQGKTIEELITPTTTIPTAPLNAAATTPMKLPKK